MPAKKTATKKSAPRKKVVAKKKAKYLPFTKDGILFNYSYTVGIYSGYYKGNMINTLDKKMFLTDIITPTSGSTHVKKDIKSSSLSLIKKKIDINTDFIKEFKKNNFMPAKKTATKKSAPRKKAASKKAAPRKKAVAKKKAAPRKKALTAAQKKVIEQRKIIAKEKKVIAALTRKNKAKQKKLSKIRRTSKTVRRKKSNS